MNIIATFRFAEKTEHYKKIMWELERNNVHDLRINLGRGELYEKTLHLRYLKEQGYLDKFNLMFDLPFPGSKYRMFQNEKNIDEIAKDECIVLAETKHTELEKSYIAFLPWETIEIGENLSLGDGEIGFVVVKKLKDGIVIKSKNSGVIRGNRAIVFQKGIIFRNNDLMPYILIMQEFKPQYIALSFLENANDLCFIRRILEEKLDYMPIIYSKIETQKGVDNLSEILSKTDRIMLGRGDLALNSDIKKFGENQDCVVEMCKMHKVPFCIATDVLISLYNSPIPTRGDLIDLYYMKHFYKCEEVVCSAGIACTELISRFVYLVNGIEE